MTHTYALMEVSRAAFDEIKAKLLAAGYDHAVHDDGATLDMHGIALVVDPCETADDSSLVEKLHRLVRSTGAMAGHFDVSPGGTTVRLPVAAAERLAELAQHGLAKEGDT